MVLLERLRAAGRHAVRCCVRYEADGLRRVALILARAGLLVLIFSTSACRARGEYRFDKPTSLGPVVNSFDWDGWPAISPDGLELYFSSNRPGGQGLWDLWVATRETTEDAFFAPEPLPPPINLWDSWEQDPDLSADGLTLYYVSADRDQSEPDDAIFSVTRSATSEPWGTPVKLGPNVNTSDFFENAPNISSDGLELYFARTPGPTGDLSTYDLWYSTRAATADPWGPATGLGISLPGYYDYDPSLSHDDLALFFTSERPGQLDNCDVWVTTRARKSDPWEEPVNVSAPINTTGFDGMADLSADGAMLYFVRGTYPFDSNLDLWQARRSITGDMDSDGDVDFDDITAFVLGMNDPVAYESQFGVPPSQKGDTDGDGDIDHDDIAGLVTLLGGGTQEDARAIPEPSALLLLAAAGLLVGVYCRQ